jgi:SAM-dependent methyltransferase
MTTTSIDHAHAPDSQLVVWERWWAGVNDAPGEIVWDPDASDLEADLEVFGRAFDPDRPVIDLGCGNGRQTRFLARRFRTVIGADISPSAIRRAAAAENPANVSYHVLDASAPDQGTPWVRSCPKRTTTSRVIVRRWSQS